MSPSRTHVLIVTLAGVLASCAWAQQPQFTPIMEFSGGQVYGVHAMGDVNGDLVPDCCLRYGMSAGTNGIRMVSVSTGALIWDVPWPHYLTGSADAGDVDGDGKRDVIVSDDYPTGSGTQWSVTVLSGANGSVVFTVVGAPLQQLGYRLSSAGDANGDGYADVLVRGATGADFVLLLRGGPAGAPLTGTVLQTFNEPSFGGYSVDYGRHMGPLGDLNGDGFGEFYITSTSAPTQCTGGTNNNAAGWAFVVDGATLVAWPKYFAPCWTYPNGPAWLTAAKSVSDLDGDGKIDLVVGIMDGNGHAGYLSVFSGASLTNASAAPIPIYSTPPTSSASPVELAFIGDLTGDGIGELAVLMVFFNQAGSPNSAIVYNGSNGALLATIPGMWAGGSLSRLAGPGDVNGDGVPDLISPAYTGGIGIPRVYSGAPTYYAAASQSSLGSGCNPLGGAAPTLAVSGSTLGTTATIGIGWPAPFSHGALFTGAPGTPTSIGSGCSVYLDLSTISQFGPVIFYPPVGVPYPVNVPVPLMWSIAGAQIGVQGLALSNAGAYALTNGINVVAGF